MVRIDWSWWFAVGISAGAFLLLFPNPVSPSVLPRDWQMVQPYDYRPSFCVRRDLHRDFRCASTASRRA